jgi:hypothetical protein
MINTYDILGEELFTIHKFTTLGTVEKHSFGFKYSCNLPLTQEQIQTKLDEVSKKITEDPLNTPQAYFVALDQLETLKRITPWQ